MPAYAVDLLGGRLGGLAGARVLILGVAYRGGVKETAFCGAFALRDALAAPRREVVAADPLYDDDELRALGFDAVGRRRRSTARSCRPTTREYARAGAGRAARRRGDRRRPRRARPGALRGGGRPLRRIGRRLSSAASAVERGHDALAGAAVAVELGPLGRRRALQRRQRGVARRGRRARSSPRRPSRPTRSCRAASRTARRRGRPPSARRRSRSAPRARWTSSEVKSR